MDYRRFGDTLVVRMDPGEEILEQLKLVSEREQIKLAEISALGAVNDITVGVFDTVEKKFYGNRFQDSLEIVSLTGTVSTMNGEYYAHLHMSAGNNKGEVFGGHLNKAVVSATCEMIVRIINGQVDRAFSETVGLNLFKFD